MSIFKNYRKIFIITAIALFFALVIIIPVFFLNNTSIKDNAYLPNSSNAVIEYPEIKRQFQAFQETGGIFLYEYTDVLSYPDTLVYYYFLYNNSLDIQWRKVEEETIAYLDSSLYQEETINDLVNVIYYYSLLVNKYNLVPCAKLNDFLRRADAYLFSLSEKDIITLNNVMKLYESKRVTESIITLNRWENYTSCAVISEDISAQLSFETINAILSNNKKQIKDALGNVFKSYLNSFIDTEELIIYLNFFPEWAIMECSSEYMDIIFDYCESNRYYLSCYTCFAGFRLCELYDEDKYLEQAERIYHNMPKSSDGFVPAIAQIIPSFRRLFHFSEVCKLFGVDIDQSCVYEFASNITYISPEDYYYISLLSLDFSDLEIDIAKLSGFVDKLENIELNLSNYYNFYYLCKAALLNNIDCKTIIDKMNAFYANCDEKHAMIDIWNNELLFFIGSEMKDIENLEKALLDLDEDSAIQIDTYYHYALLVKNANLDCPKEVKEKIIEEVRKHNTVYGGFGGYWMNSEFHYVDISQTYKCLYLYTFSEGK